MSTFKSSTERSRSLHIDRLFGHVRLLIKCEASGARGFCLSTDDAPALALAILEAAGVVPTHHSSYQNGTAEALEHVAQSLKDEVGIEAAKAKEAAALEKLTSRRNEVMNELRGDSLGSYDRSTAAFQRAIDRIIELEDRAQS